VRPGAASWRHNGDLFAIYPVDPACNVLGEDIGCDCSREILYATVFMIPENLNVASQHRLAVVECLDQRQTVAFGQ